MDSSDLMKIDKLLGPDQWSIWKFQMRVLLNASDLFEIVTGKIPKPVVSNTVLESKVLEWEKLDRKAQKIIVMTIGSQPLVHIMNCSTSHEMWKKLEAVYEQKAQTNIHLLQQKFYSFAKDPTEDMATHISKLESLVQQLKDYGESVSPTMLITKILMTLPPEYNHFYAAWESTAASDKTVENLTARLVMEESRLATQLQAEPTTNALIARKGMRSDTSTVNSNGSSRSKGKSKLGKCFFCKKPGHWKKNCPSRNASMVQRNPSRDAFVCTMVANGEAKCDEWFLDSGASDHMTFRQDWIVNYKPFEYPRSVRVGNGEKISALGYGDIHILAYDNKQWFPKFLSNVLLVPDIHLNLFSSNAALDKNLQLVSNKNKCELLQEGRTVAVGVRHFSLFRMMFRVEKPATANVCAKVESIKIWHERLGHQNLKYVRSFLRERGIDFHDDDQFFCEACALGKLHKLPFEKSNSRAGYPGELVHADLCGPMQNLSVGGSRYFLLFKDDFSRYRTVYFLKEKTEVLGCFEKFIKKVKIDTGLALKTIRTDNGLEFINAGMKSLLEGQHVCHQTSVPYSPQQNGRAEREMRTIVEAARTMIHARSLSLRLWAEAVNMAVYVLNRTAPTGIIGRTALDLWLGTNQKLNFQDMQVFGTECFAHIPSQKRRKWDAKSQPGIFVGYPENTKGYRIYFPASGKIEVNRDTVFKNSFTAGQDNEEVILKLPCYPEIDACEQRDVKNIKVHRSSNDEEKSDIPCDIPEHQEIFHDATANEDEEQCIEEPLKNRLRGARKLEDKSMAAILEGCAFVAERCEPATYREVFKSIDSEKWQAAMNEEVAALNKNDTWELVEPPPGKKVIDNRWVYKIKNINSNEPERYKARLVIRGFTQEYGVDYLETFSPVARFDSIRAILAIAASKSMHLKQFDIKTAFLNGDLQDEVYMQQPEGFDDGSGRVCRLKKSLYGLKQASRCWNLKFSKFLRSFQLRASVADPCVFVGKNIILAIYVDDGLVAGRNENDINQLVESLQNTFEVKVYEARCFLGLDINRQGDGSIFLGQPEYADRILTKFKMSEAKPVSTPADASIYKDLDNSSLAVETRFPYREAVGSLMYLAIGSRPDISYALGIVSRHLENPTIRDVAAVKRIIRYVKGTKNLGILFKSNLQLIPRCFSDADFAGDPDTRRSTSGFVFLLGQSPISWASQRQKCVALSTMEAEYIAGAQAAKEMVWFTRLLSELLTEECEQPTLCLDNQSAIKLVRNPEYHKRSKHIEVKFHFIREKFAEGLFKISYVSTEDQLADIFTKPLRRNRLELLRNKIGIVSFEK